MRTPTIRAPRQARSRRSDGDGPKIEPVDGGKAAARLHQFERERDLGESDVTHPRTSAQAERRRAAMIAAQPARDGGDDGAAAAPTQFMAALAQREAMERTVRAVPVAAGWRPLGPFAIPHGQTYGSGPGSRPAVAGRVATIAVDPGNAGHILAGAAGGGVWESRDAGATWSPRTDTQPSLWTGAIAFNPSNPAVVYAGTGEGNQISWLGAGLLRSTNGGTTWNLLTAAPFAGTGFYDLVVDPLNGNHLLAATTGGLFESSDGGVTWAQRRAQRTWDLSMAPAVAGNPNSTREVFAACADGLFRSTNGGQAWSRVTLPGAPGTFQRIEVCHAPSNGNVVYVFAAGPPAVPVPEDPRFTMPTAYLWRRTMTGGAFTAVPPDPALRTGQAWYDWFAAVAPNNPDVLYLGAINVHKGIRSPTNTWSWSTISARSVGDSIHPDQHAIAFSPFDPNVVYIGNDGGVYRSPNGGVTWQALNKGLSITELEYLAQHPQFEAWLIAGTQDNGTVRFEGEEVWYHVEDGDGGDCGANAASPYTCYHTFFGMGMGRSTTGGGWGSWGWIGPNVPSNYNAQFYPPMEVNGPVVAQAGQSVFVSTNMGTTFTEVALPGTVMASALDIPTATRIYVGTGGLGTASDGRIFRLDLAGGTWTVTALGQPRRGYASDILADPRNPNRLWVTYSSLTGAHVFRSDNGGGSWTNVSAGLPNIAANAIVLDPADSNIVYVGMDVGVFRSTNAGASWSSFNNLLPNALVRDLVFHAPSRLLRAATQSRGLWEIAADTGTMPDVEVYLRDSVVDTGRRLPSPSGIANPFQQGAQTYWWQSTDIKVDSPSFQRPSLADVDFEVFEDDHGVFFAGIIHENAQRGRTVRVMVQVHNRGMNAATNVAVRAFFADASVGLPNLPTGFWSGFPSNVLPATSPWRAVGPHQVIPRIDGGRSQIIGFEWPVPTTAAQHTCLLAVVSAGNDAIATTETNIGALVLNQKKAALKNLTVVNPPPTMGARVLAVPLDLWRTGSGATYSLGMDRTPTSMVSGIVFSRRLSTLAKQSGLPKITITEEHRAELARLALEFPRLKEQLDLETAYRAPRSGAWLSSFTLDAKQPEPIVVLVEPKPRVGQWSILQSDAEGAIVGGYTLEAISTDRRG